VNTVTANFNTIMKQMTETSQRKKQHLTWIQKRYYTTVSLPRQTLTMKLSKMHFAVIGSDNRTLWAVGRSISLTCYLNMTVEMCEFNSWWVPF